MGVMGIELITRRMMEELEILEFDENSLSGKGKISIDETTLVRTELNAIRKACCQYSQTQMTNLEIVHDGESFTTEKRQNDSGQVITDIKFGFEAKVKET